MIAERFYLGDNQGNNVDFAPADIHNINGSYPLTWFNNVTGAWVQDQAVDIENGKIAEYKVRMKITFILKD